MANIHLRPRICGHYSNTCQHVVFQRLHHCYVISMGEEKPDTLDFVKDFQEYLSQQTQHVNMISGSVSGVKEADELPAGNQLFVHYCKFSLFGAVRQVLLLLQFYKCLAW